MRDMSENNKLSMMIRGGGKRVRYLAMVDYQNEFGLLNENYTHYSDRYNSQIRDYSLALRANMDIDVTTSTLLKFNLSGAIGEKKQPNGDINSIFYNFYQVPSNAFPVKTASGNWGGGNSLFQMNPIADFADIGYVQDNSYFLEADLRLKQDLSMWIKGMSAEVAVAYDNSAVFEDIGSKTYMYEQCYIDDNDELISKEEGTNSALSVSSSKLDSQRIRSTVEARLNYEYAVAKNRFWASAIYRQESEEPLGSNTSYYRQNVMGIGGYNYDNRYLIDIVANYYGTSALLKGDKFRFYPALSAGWNLSEESFLSGRENLNLLRLRFSWGRSALDNISYGLGHHFWGESGNYPFDDGLTQSEGMVESKLPVRGLELETSNKYNVGVDLRMWNNFTASVEYYHDRRTDILVTDNRVSEIFGITASPVNIGENKMQGVELDLGWHQQLKDFSYYVNANWAWNKTEVIEDGQAYQKYDYLYTKGHRIDQIFGLEAIGYFNDEADIESSPEQTFSQVRPGDIKYRDRNNDKKIDSEDRIAIGKSSSIPDMIMGLNLGFEYKGIGLDLTFNGVKGLTKLLSKAGVHHPLRNGKSNISDWYLNDRMRWTEKTKETANVPRLSTLSNENNYQTSTQWLTDGSFFKLRNVNLHYTFPHTWTNRLGMEKLQLYAKAMNVFSIDKIQNFNCEDINLGYPDLFSLCLGINIEF